MKTKVIPFLLSSVLVVCSFASTAVAQSRWKGTSTNMSRNFNYGPVSFTLRGRTIKDFKVEGVTTSGCGGFKNVVVPRIAVRGNRIRATYRPIPGIDDFIRVNGTILGSRASGTFSEGPLCVNAGRWSARKR
jgi:hypothetical protein